MPRIDLRVLLKYDLFVPDPPEAQRFRRHGRTELPLAMAFPPGTLIGRYEIITKAGAGGMGEVYRARDTRLGRTVAIKMLPEQIAHDPQLRQRLRQEAAAVAALNHPHICSLYDLDSAGGLDFLVLEYLEGETLRERLSRGPLPLAEAMEVGAEIGDALAAAHGAGIVHRDLKPSNVMLTREGAKLLDFGLAKVQRSPGDESPLPSETLTATRPGMVTGTLPYMAPEQLEGRTVDSRVDVFAFGALMFEMITGCRAFPGESSASVAAAILRAEPKRPSDVVSDLPRFLDRIVRVCLAREPEERWQSMTDVTRMLRLAASDELSEPTPIGAAQRSPRFHVHAIWAAFALGLAMLAWTLGHPRPVEVPPPPHSPPLILLMDSPLSGRVYDPRTAEAGGTNADDITDALRELPVTIQKESTSPMWHREEQVAREGPDLVISHFSSFYDERVAESGEAAGEQLLSAAESRLLLFFGYVAVSSPRTRFLVYSRGQFIDPVRTNQWVKDWETRLPAVRGRLHTFRVPDGQGATFRDASTARLLREEVKELLELP